MINNILKLFQKEIRGFDKDFQHLYLILPRIDYARIIYWPQSVTNIDDIEMIQKYFTRRIFSSCPKLSYLERVYVTV